MNIKQTTLVATFSLLLASCGGEESKKESSTDDKSEPKKEEVEKVEKKELKSYSPDEYVVLTYYSDGGKKGYATPDEEPVFGSKKWDEASPFSNGFAKVGKKTGSTVKYAFIDETGKELTGFDYVDAGEFSDGMAWVQKEKDGLFGYVNSTGELVLPAQYLNNWDFRNGRALISNKKFNRYMGLSRDIVYGYINIAGDTVIAMDNFFGGTYGNGMAPVLNKSERYVYIDTSGNPVFDKSFDNADEFAHGIAPAAKNKKWGFIDTTGEFVIQPAYDSYKFVYRYNSISELFDYRDKSYTTDEGYYIVSKGDNWGFINTSGEIVLDFDFADVGVPKNGLVDIKKVKNKEKYKTNYYEGIFDLKQSKLVIEPKYDEIRKLADHSSEVSYADSPWYKVGIDTDPENYDTELNGIINIKTGYYLEPKFEDIQAPSEGLIAVKLDGLWGWADLEGNIKIKPKYYHVGEFNDGEAYALEEKDGDHIYIDKNGKKIEE